MVKKIIKALLKCLPLRKIILFESVPDLSDNTFQVYEELVKRGLGEKYKLVWSCWNQPRKDYPKNNNEKYVYCGKRFLTLYYQYVSKAVVCCNRFLGGNRKGQTVYYLMHGGPIKHVRAYYTCPGYVSYMITPGEGVSELCAYEFNIDVKKCVGLGYPRNDALFAPINLSDYFGSFKKYVLWYPTVRQFQGGKTTGCVNPIPIIHDEENVRKLNEEAALDDVLIIIKPHFAQIAENIRKIELSNIVFIDDDFFKDNNIIPYRFVGACDALLTDYSSVYFDYLNVNRPVGLIWEDLEEYKQNPGVIDRFDELMAGGEKIYNIDDLCSFCERVSKGIDELMGERNRIRKLTNREDLLGSTARVADFIVERL